MKNFFVNKISFAIGVCTICLTFTSCIKDLPVNTTVNTPPPSPPSMGSVYFWREDSLWVYYGHVFISINNEVKTLNGWYEGGAPAACGAMATVGFNLPYANYIWKAWKSNSTDTAKGNITITQTCILNEIRF